MHRAQYRSKRVTAVNYTSTRVAVAAAAVQPCKYSDAFQRSTLLECYSYTSGTAVLLLSVQQNDRSNPSEGTHVLVQQQY